MLKIIAAAVLLMGGLVSEACAGPTTCTVRNSVPASVSEIATHPESYRSQCVVTRGVMLSAILFANVDGIYVQPPDSSSPASSGLRLGLDNIKDLMRLHFPDNDRRRPDDERDLLDFLLGSHSPFEVLNSEHVILIDGITYDDPAEYRAIVCFCRVGSCSGRWPIASFDADNLPDRPYACSKIQTHLAGGKYTQAFDTPEETIGLAERR